RGNRTYNERIGQPGPHSLLHSNALGLGGSDGGVGDGGQVIAENRSADHRTAHQTHIDIQLARQRTHHRGDRGHRTGGSSAGGGNDYTDQKRHHRDRSEERRVGSEG